MTSMIDFKKALRDNQKAKRAERQVTGQPMVEAMEEALEDTIAQLAEEVKAKKTKAKKEVK